MAVPSTMCHAHTWRGGIKHMRQAASYPGVPHPVICPCRDDFGVTKAWQLPGDAILPLQSSLWYPVRPNLD